MAGPLPQPDAVSHPAAALPAPRENVREFEPRKVEVGRHAAIAALRPPEPVTPTPLLAGLASERAEQETIDVESLQREAFQQGYEEGERSGLERAAAQYHEAIAGFGRSALELVTLKPRLRAETERELVDLAFSIARRILKRESSVDPDAVVGLVRNCLEQFNRADVRKLQVHPQDFAAVNGFFQQQQNAPRLEVISDPKISRGGAIFQTSQGVLDARFEVQLEEIEKGLTDR